MVACLGLSVLQPLEGDGDLKQFLLLVYLFIFYLFFEHGWIRGSVIDVKSARYRVYCRTVNERSLCALNN